MQEKSQQLGDITEKHEGLKKKDPEEEIKKFKTEKLTLQHRIILHKHLPEIEEFIINSAWINTAENASISTRHVSLKHNLFLFTPQGNIGLRKLVNA